MQDSAATVPHKQENNHGATRRASFSNSLTPSSSLCNHSPLRASAAENVIDAQKPQKHVTIRIDATESGKKITDKNDSGADAISGGDGHGGYTNFHPHVEKMRHPWSRTLAPSQVGEMKILEAQAENYRPVAIQSEPHRFGRKKVLFVVIFMGVGLLAMHML